MGAVDHLTHFRHDRVKEPFAAVSRFAVFAKTLFQAVLVSPRQRNVLLEEHLNVLVVRVVDEPLEHLADSDLGGVSVLQISDEPLPCVFHGKSPLAPEPWDRSLACFWDWTL